LSKKQIKMNRPLIFVVLDLIFYARLCFWGKGINNEKDPS